MITMSPKPKIQDCSLTELWDESISLSEIEDWMADLRKFGVDQFELPLDCLKELQGPMGAEIIVSVEPTQANWELLRSSVRGQAIWGIRLLEAGPRWPGKQWPWADLGVHVSLVIPDSAEMDPVTLSEHLRWAVSQGFQSVELVGRAGNPSADGIQQIMDFSQGVLLNTGIGVHWSSDHGHGLALSQAMTAWSSGAQSIRASLLGYGGQGQIPLELLLVNMNWGYPGQALAGLTSFVNSATERFELEVPYHYPVFGRDSFRTCSGVRIDQILSESADLQSLDHSVAVASLAPAWVGATAVLEVGPQGGRSSLRHWLRQNHLSQDVTTIEKLAEQVRERGQVLSDLELVDLVHDLMV